jgi:hypothetical protein
MKRVLMMKCKNYRKKYLIVKVEIGRGSRYALGRRMRYLLHIIKVRAAVAGKQPKLQTTD